MSGGRADGWQSQRRSLGGLLAVVSRLFAGEHHARLKAAGLDEIRPGSGNLFEHIGEDGSTVGEMAVRAGISPQAMVQVVDYLEEGGFVARTSDASDRRVKIVQLTERGRAADRIAREAIAEVEREWADLLGPERFRQLRELLLALIQELETRDLATASGGHKTDRRTAARGASKTE